MEIYFVLLKINYPKTLQPLTEVEGSYRPYGITYTIDGRKCTLYKDFKALKNANDVKHVRQGFLNLYHRCHTGLPLKDLYDEKELHNTHDFSHEGKQVTIFRIREGCIRFYFIYLCEKKVIILKVSSKRKDKLTKSEQSELEELAKKALAYQDHDLFLLRVLK